MHFLSRIYTCSHTLVAPHGLQNLGKLALRYVIFVIRITNEIQIHAYIKGELTVNFGVQKF